MSEQLTPPTAPKHPRTTDIHGRSLHDDYHWLRDRENPEVIAHLEAENAYADAMMAHTTELQKRLYDEFVGRLKQTDMSVPTQRDDYFYYTRTEEGKQYAIRCRRHGSMAADEQILLDLNAIAEEKKVGYVGLGNFHVSPDHTRLAYSLDLDGSEQYTIRVLDLETGEHLPDEIPNTYYSLAWGNDNDSFLYTRVDEAHRPDRIFLHRIGTPVESDRMIFHEPDGLFRAWIGQTLDRTYATITAQSSETSEVHLLSLDDLGGELRIVEPRRAGHRYSLEHRHGRLYIQTNDEAPDNRIMTAPADDPGQSNWVEFAPTEADVLIEGFEVFENFIAIARRADGLTGVRIYRFDADEWHDVEFPEPTFYVHAGSNPVFTADRFRLVYQSMTTPQTTYDYDPVARELTLLKQQEVLGGFNRLDYRSERITARSEDGTEVPISLVYRTDSFTGDGSNPCLLYGYGSYGINLDPYFSMNWLSLLDRGFVCAIAHIRGGQEMGRRWYEEGKMSRKQNTFIDFVAAARHLVAEGYSSHDRMAIQGGSAGGLLVGAVINRAPEIASAALAQVPFVDVVNTMLDDTLPLTVGEYEEWGNPNEAEAFADMIAYSPYDNIRQQPYPDLLITAGLNDPRVQYWEPAKWAAKLREYTEGDPLILLKTNMGAGHGGASGRYDLMKETAFEYAFLIDRLTP